MPIASFFYFLAVHLPCAGLTGEEAGGAMDRELTEQAQTISENWLEKEGIREERTAVGIVTGS